MNILFPCWKNFGLEDITDTFRQLGHTVTHYSPEPNSYRLDPRYKSELKKYIRKEQIDLIFSSNYFPILSDACHEVNIPYISWCYDNPLILTYSKTIFHPCNYLFLFDSQMVQDLRELGAEHVWYLPMAVNAKRLNALKATAAQQKIVRADISFVGSLYTEKHTLYDRMECLDDHTRGYLEGAMNAQMQIYGASFLENTLTDEIIEKMLESMPIKLHADGLETYRYVYANYFLYRKITQTERTMLLRAVSDALPDMLTSSGERPQPLKLYTPEKTPFLTNIRNMGTIQYLGEMPLVFRHSKINLNITLRSIKTGIPLRAMDIMGAGGFLLTNYQNDFNLHFTDGTDYVSYNSPEDMLDKIKYYLSHDAEREAIAKNGWEKVCQEHTFEKRIETILATTGI